MNKSDAKRQLCKMLGEVATMLDQPTPCVCDDPNGATEPEDIPDAVVEEMWRLVNWKMVGNRWVRDPVLVEFAAKEAARANSNGEYASKMEVALMETRHTLETMTAGLEEVARRHGWSEEVNCPPWAWLDDEIERLQGQMTVEQLMSIGGSSDVLIFAGHVFLCRDVKLTTGCVRCGREWNEAEICLRETCDGPVLTTERLIAAIYGKDGESSDE